MVARGIKTRDGELHEMLTGRGLTRTVGPWDRAETFARMHCEKFRK